MVRCIVAIDDKRGLATDKGIPWELPADQRYFVDQTVEGIIVMGSATYREFTKPMHGRTNYVATHGTTDLAPGFVAVQDVASFFTEHASQTINDIGGAGLFAATIQFADELVITQVTGDFHCTKLFPEYKADFVRISQSEPQQENDITYYYEIWHRK